jgi:hypothetical protein
VVDRDSDARGAEHFINALQKTSVDAIKGLCVG